MGVAQNKVKAKAMHEKARNRTEGQINMNEARSVIRESRHGFRGFGAFQMKRIYSAEGVHVIDIGGPPVAGR